MNQHSNQSDDARILALARRACGAALVLSAAGVLVWSCSETPRPKHLLMITLDTMRADRLPPYGARDIDTPALSALAAGGAVFEQAFAAVPLTLPSHASLFTGMNPPRLGVRDNAGGPVGRDARTLAELFSERGFQTGAVVASAVLAPGRGLDQGFATYDMAGWDGCRPASARRNAGQVVDAAIAWLLGREQDPFFLWVHLYDTHRPYRLPSGYEAAHADQYSAAIAYEDGEISRLLQFLGGRGVLDDTLVVVAADHGESLGDHGEDTHGIFVYQPVLHVPLIMHGPGVKPMRIASVVRLADVVPTIAGLFDLELPPDLDGISLAPLLRWARETQTREVYAESLYPLRFGWGALRSLRADRYKLIDAPRPELYDLLLDPRERHDIIESRPEVARAMQTRLRELELDETTAQQPDGSVSKEVEARLASLGYASGERPAVEPADTLPDPKDHIHTFNDLGRRQLQFASIQTAAECPAPRRP